MDRLDRDLTSPRTMAFKAALFLLITLLVGVLLVGFRDPVKPSRAVAGAAYALGVWSFARAYYFAFYVIERYCDPAFKYAGVWSALVWIARHGRRRTPRD